jgi:TolB-like protein
MMFSEVHTGANRISLLRAAFIMLIAVVCGSCSTTPTLDGGSDAEQEIRVLQRLLVQRPNDPAVQRDLGVACFQTKRYDAAKLYLNRSYTQVADDPRTLFYYGMTLEYLGEMEAALRIYINYTDVPSSSQYRKLIEGRYRTLVQEVVRQQFQRLLAEEQKLGTEGLKPSVIAVFPFAYQGTDPKYRALGKGLGELILTDLGQVQSLRIVERIRIETLLEELKFGQSRAVDPATAPRLGKLLSAGQLISGSYDLSKGQVLTVNVASLDALSRETPKVTTASDELESLFKLEKDLVFSILDKLGITLTQQERENIMRVPTRNLQAFLLYCLGLEKEDAKDFRGASDLYYQAISLDPAFAPAKTRADAAVSVVVAGGPKENALAIANSIEPGKKQEPATAQKQNGMVNARLQTLGNNVGLNFYPGQDDRKAAEDAVRFGIIEEGLGLPPPPPSR